ncbi:MAG: hypothetical protein QXD88_00055 [Candidatus Anstonellales archaeon]
MNFNFRDIQNAIHREVDSMVSIYRKVRKPEQQQVTSLFNQIIFITFIVGSFGIVITILSIILDLVVRLI